MIKVLDLFSKPYVEESWRIVDPVLRLGTPISEYEPNTWGPQADAPEFAPIGG